MKQQGMGIEVGENYKVLSLEPPTKSINPRKIISGQVVRVRNQICPAIIGRHKLHSSGFVVVVPRQCLSCHSLDLVQSDLRQRPNWA